MDPIVVSYHDSLLRQSDVSLLDGPNWLNDKVIGFYFEYLEREVFKEYADKVCFITPDVTQFIKLYKGPELSVFLEPLNLHSKDVVVLAVNDNSSSECAGGSHWSILVYLRNTNAIHHYDSLRQSNLSSAKHCAKRLLPFLKCDDEPSFQDDADCPQQQNSHDCGVYALCFAEVICQQQFKSAGSIKLITSEHVVEFRTKVKQLIEKLS